MLHSLPRFALGTLGLGVSAFLMQHVVLVPPPSGGGLEIHVEQFGAMLLAGAALGISIPATARRMFVPAMLAIGAALSLLEVFAPEIDGWIFRLVMDWFGATAGLLIIKGLYRSWTAMFDKHLVVWGGGVEIDDGADEDYDLPPAR